MALISSIIKNSHLETVVKVEGANDTATIALTGLVNGRQALGATGSSGYLPPAVNISGVYSSGLPGSTLLVNRGATGATGYIAVAASPDHAVTMQYNQYGFTNNLQNTNDLVVTHGGATGANVTTYLVLHKVAGYYSKVEYEQYGAYDDESRVGASTTLSGSPDKV